MQRREFLRESWAASFMTGAVLDSTRAGTAGASASGKVRVLCWSERTEPASVYPQGINGAIADFLRRLPDLDVRTASINDAEQGIGKAAIDATDVLIWWGHLKHKDVDDSRVDEVIRQIKERGLGFIGLHSTQGAKVFTGVLGCSGEIGGWREDGKREFLKCVAPAHPVAQGLADFTIPQTEMYDEPFQVPPPERIIFFSYWEGGEQFRSCNVWSSGKGRIVYFRPGHEAFPIYYQELPLRVVKNSVYWCAARK
jgi:trehalose utilization protein